MDHLSNNCVGVPATGINDKEATSQIIIKFSIELTQTTIL